MSYEDLKTRLKATEPYMLMRHIGIGDFVNPDGLDTVEAITALEAERDRLREALEDIAIYGCGMLNQPIAMNCPEEEWLEKRIREYERRARQALGGSND